MQWVGFHDLPSRLAIHPLIPELANTLLLQLSFQHSMSTARNSVLYAFSTSEYCIHQRRDVLECDWRVYSDSDHAGNAEIQNKRKSQCSFIVMNGEAPITWGSKASGVQLEDNYLHSLSPTAHPDITDMRAYLSLASAAAEIYSTAIS